LFFSKIFKKVLDIVYHIWYNHYSKGESQINKGVTNMNKKEIVKFAKEAIAYYAKCANRAAEKEKEGVNLFQQGRISALKEILEQAGCHVETVGTITYNSKIVKVKTITVDGETVFGA
jgi:hypothetical protein